MAQCPECSVMDWTGVDQTLAHHPKCSQPGMDRIHSLQLAAAAHPRESLDLRAAAELEDQLIDHLYTEMRLQLGESDS